MADENFQKIPPEATTATHPSPSSTPEQTETPPPSQEPESISEPPLTSSVEPESSSEPPLSAVALDLQQKCSLPPTEPPLPAEEKLKEAITVIQRDTPLESPPPEPPLSAEPLKITASEKGPSARVSQPLAATLAVSQESEKGRQTRRQKATEPLASFKEESSKISDLSPRFQGRKGNMN
ncbi:hypothetical protein OROHE_006846 [Orobanche hederae]